MSRCGARILLALVGVLAMGTARADTAPPIAGVWVAENPSARLRPSDGAALPFTQAGAALYTKIARGLRSGAIVDEAVHTCLPEGMPRALTSAYPFQIIVTADQVAFVHQANRAYRTVALTGTHADPAVWDPSYMGDGIARWQGDAMVIDSTNFKAGSLYLDASGLPASAALHIVEHITVDHAGKALVDVVTIEDPVTFSKPWSTRLIFRRRDDLRVATDWVCGQPHRTISAPPPRAPAAASLSASQAALSGYWHDILPPGVPMIPTPPDVFAKMQPAIAAQFKQDEAAAAAGRFVGDPNTACMPAAIGGTGSSGGLAYGEAVLVEPRQITFLYELNRGVHFAYVGDPLPRHPMPSWQGTSVAHWQGDTLVVETAGFNGRNMLMLGTNPRLRNIDNIAFSTRMHIVERYRILPNGQLEDSATFDDPGAFTAPFTLTTHFVRAQPFQEYICAENNHEGGVPTGDGGVTGFGLPKAP